jgi:hypothetical protein
MDLDDVIPNPRYRICHSRVARAPLPAVWDALHRVTMSALPLGHALEGMRVLPARLSGKKPGPLAGRSFLDVTPIPVLFSRPCRTWAAPAAAPDEHQIPAPGGSVLLTHPPGEPSRAPRPGRTGGSVPQVQGQLAVDTPRRIKRSGHVRF